METIQTNWSYNTEEAWKTKKPIEHIKLVPKEHPGNSGARILEKNIFAKHKIRIPHNTIHMVLKHAGYAKDEPNKQKRIKTLRKAMKEAEPYGGIRSILSDHGSQFLKEFNKGLNPYGIKHIYGRVKQSTNQ